MNTTTAREKTRKPQRAPRVGDAKTWHSKDAHHRHEVLTGLHAVFVESLKREEITDKAESVTDAVMVRFIDTYGGERIYFPKDMHVGLPARDVEIWNRCKTADTWEVARYFGITEPAVRQARKRAEKHMAQTAGGAL